MLALQMRSQTLSILLNNHNSDNAPWQQALSECLPDMPIHCYPDIPDVADIHYAVVWNHPHGDLLNYPNLRAVLVLGAGMDHIDAEPLLPDAHIVRLIDPAVGDDMSQYSLYWAMHFQRCFEKYRAQASARQWQRYEVPLSNEFRVSLVGLGPIGAFIAERFALNAFKAQGWSRSQKTITGVATYHGEDGLKQMLANTDVLVNCLPLNTATHHFLDKAVLAQLPRGSFVVNVGRGAVIEDSALLSLLDTGHIAGAALDVFVDEPLPVDNPYWGRENVHITPHIAGGTYAKSATRVIADNIIKIENGEQPFPIYQPMR
jgi:glyoxylate/hydroxypyruvate reductase A